MDTGFKGGSRLACKHRVDRYEGLTLSTVNVFSIKFGNSEKATKFEKIFHVKIFSNFVAFSEYPNFNIAAVSNFMIHVSILKSNI